jgi:YVTN family beta-propeller protein
VARRTHRFSTAGNYTVTLTAKDAQGNQATSQFVQAIYLPHPTGKPSSSSAIIYRNDEGVNTVWNVNPDSHSVSGFNASTFSKIAEIAVGKNPRVLAFAPDGTLWVTNKASFSVSVIDTKQKKVIKTIELPYASQPYGIVFAKKKQLAYIVLEASGELLKLESKTGRVISSLSLGKNPRHISINAAEDRLYISRYITPALPDESTKAPKTIVNGVYYGGEILVIDTASFTLQKKIVLKHNNEVDSEENARGIPNYLGAMAISPDGHSAWVPSKQDNIKRGKLRDGQDLTFDSAVRSISSKVNLDTHTEVLASRFDHDNGGIASAAAFGKFGSYLFVALEGSREIEVIDAYSHTSLFRIRTDRAPQGLAISDDGLTLFSHNFMERSITVYDLFNLIYARSSDVPLLARLKTVAREPLTPTVLRGKQLFYDSSDPRLSKEQYSSCASCHNGGRSDGRTWDMTGFGEGLRNTISLLGHGGMDQGMLHWSGNFDEVQDFEVQIRGLSGGTGLMKESDFHSQTRNTAMGTKKAGGSRSLDELAHFVESLKTVPASPYKERSLSTSASKGKNLFNTKGCVTCHSGTQFTDSAPNIRHDIGTIKETTGQRLNTLLDGLDTPTLLGVWQTAPYLHDGAAKTLEAAIIAHNTTTLTDNEAVHLANYLQQLDHSAKVSTPIKTANKGGGGVLASLLLFLLMLASLNKLRDISINLSECESKYEEGANLQGTYKKG